MKKHARLLAALVFALVMIALVMKLFSRSPAVSLQLVEYRRWPHGAELQLSNGTANTIQYLADASGGAPALLSKAPDGAIILPDGIFSLRDLKPGRSVTAYIRLEPGGPPKWVGANCKIPPTQFSKTFEAWRLRIGTKLGINAFPAEFTEVWYPAALSLPALPPPAAGN